MGFCVNYINMDVFLKVEMLCIQGENNSQKDALQLRINKGDNDEGMVVISIILLMVNSRMLSAGC